MAQNLFLQCYRPKHNNRFPSYAVPCSFLRYVVVVLVVVIVSSGASARLPILVASQTSNQSLGRFCVAKVCQLAEVNLIRNDIGER